MKKITIIGANSYIARNIIYTLKNNYSEYELYLYDRAAEQVDNETNYKSIDILNLEDVNKINFQTDIIFMFIGKTGSINGYDDYDTFIDINEKALLNILNAYRNFNSKAKIIFPSTRLVYKGKKGLLKEDDIKEFKTIYAINKYACENYLKQFHDVFCVNYCIFRICVPYGTLIAKASSYGTAEFMINKASNGENITLYGDGSVRRTITYMGDLCKVLIEGAISAECCNDIYNIGGENYSLKEMAELIAERYNVGISYVPYPEISYKIETGDTVFDDMKINNIIPAKYTGKFNTWIKNL